MGILDFKCYIQNIRSEKVQKKFKTKFVNDFDIQIFNQDFYQTLLENITKLKRQKEKPNEILTCACLDTSQTCLSQAKSKRKHV